MSNSLVSLNEKGTGRTIILVPGLDGTALLFYRQIEFLAKEFHVVTFPLPDDPSASMDSLILELSEVIDQVRQERSQEKVLLCGESFGGALSMSFGLKHPEMLSGLVIVNSFPYIRKRIQLAAAPWLLKAMPWGAMRFVRRFTEGHLHSPHALREDLDEFHRRMAHVKRSGYIRRLEILRSYDIRDKLPQLSVPVLFLAGELDRLVPSVGEAEFMASQVVNARVVKLKGYGHICLINHDFNLLDYILPWLPQKV